MNEVLTQYRGELADLIIADCIDPDRSDAEVVIGLPAPSAGERQGLARWRTQSLIQPRCARWPKAAIYRKKGASGFQVGEIG
jgi:hypothetical protein